MAHPQGGSSPTVSRSNWYLEMLEFFRRGENRSTRRKTSWSKDENQQQTQPTYDAESRTRTRVSLVGGKCSHHCAIPAPLGVPPSPIVQLYQNISKLRNVIQATCTSIVLTRTWIKTGANGLLATGSALYISYNKNKTTILWLVDGSKSGCCKSISCKKCYA